MKMKVSVVGFACEDGLFSAVLDNDGRTSFHTRAILDNISAQGEPAEVISEGIQCTVHYALAMAQRAYGPLEVQGYILVGNGSDWTRGSSTCSMNCPEFHSSLRLALEKPYCVLSGIDLDDTDIANPPEALAALTHVRENASDVALILATLRKRIKTEPHLWLAPDWDRKA